MILFLSTNDTLGGAAMVTFRLVEALRRQGRDARMLVARKDSNKPWVDTVGSFRFTAAKTAERTRIFCANGFTRRNLWSVSDGSFGCGAVNHPWVKSARTIVLGWINQGMLSLDDIRRLEHTDKRIVWWMHDMWCATGICHLPAPECGNFASGCGNCPFLHGRAGSNDLSARTFARKLEVLHSFRISYLAVSSWQRKRCMESPILSRKHIEVLAHPLQIEKFPVTPSVDGIKALAGLSSGLAEAIASGRKIIAMGAARLDDPVKGLPVAVSALNRLPSVLPAAANDAFMVFFGGIKDSTALDRLTFPHIHIPFVPGELLPQLYAASAVVLSTSHFETMGATLMEGMAAGATVVTFGTAGQTDIVTDGVNGYIAPYAGADAVEELSKSIAESVARALTAPFPRESQHRSVLTRFASDAIARRFLAITHI